MIRKRKLAIVVAGVVLLAGVTFGLSVNNRDGLKSDILGAHGRAPEVYAWYSNEQWTCDGTTVSRPVQCISVKTGKIVSESSCTDTKPESSFSPFSGEDGAPSTCEQILSHLHKQRTYSAFKEDVCTSYPEVCRAFDKGNKKQPLYFSNARKSSDIGAVTTKKGLHVFEYSGSILGTQDAGMVLNSLSYEISNYNPDNLKIGNIKLYDSITTVDSLNQFYCTQEYQKNSKKLIITCALSQPKKTAFTVKDSRGYVPLYLLFDILKSETSNKVMQLKFTGGVYNGKQTNWNDQTYPVKFKTLNETDYCTQNPDRCEIIAEDISFSTPTTRLSFSPFRTTETKTLVTGDNILGEWTVSTKQGTATLNKLGFQAVVITGATDGYGYKECGVFSSYELQNDNGKVLSIGKISDPEPSLVTRFIFSSPLVVNTNAQKIRLVGKGFSGINVVPATCQFEMGMSDNARSHVETEGDNSGFGPYGYVYEVRDIINEYPRPIVVVDDKVANVFNNGNMVDLGSFTVSNAVDKGYDVAVSAVPFQILGSNARGKFSDIQITDEIKAYPCHYTDPSQSMIDCDMLDFDPIKPQNSKIFSLKARLGSNSLIGDKYQISLNGLGFNQGTIPNNPLIDPVKYIMNIEVTNLVAITLTADANNTENKDTKNVLGGTTAKVFSVDVQATNEAVDVGKVVFTYTAASGNLLAASARAELYLGDTLIATAPNADITPTAITFGGTSAGELTNLIIPQEAKELKLAIITEAMGYEKAGTVVTGVDITGVATSKATGVNSGRDIPDSGVINVATSSALFSIVPTVVTPTVVIPLSASSSVAKVKLTANSGANTIADSSSTPKVGIDSLTFSISGSEGVLANEYILYEEGKSDVIITGAASGANVTFDLIAFANRVFTTDKIYVIVPTIAINETASLTLLKNGVQYDTDAGVVNVITALPNELNFGTRTID